MSRIAYFDNLLDASVYSLDDIYEEDYIRRNYTSPTSKVRKVIKNLQSLGYIIKDDIVQKYRAMPYDGTLNKTQQSIPAPVSTFHYHFSPSVEPMPVYNTPVITCDAAGASTTTDPKEIDISLTSSATSNAS